MDGTYDIFYLKLKIPDKHLKRSSVKPRVLVARLFIRIRAQNFVPVKGLNLAKTEGGFFSVFV